MKVTFLGTGEAFGEKANTSILIDDKILLDCGMQTVQQLMKLKFDLSKIEIIWISHLHADHYFGIPAFFCAGKEDGRKNVLEILGGPRTKEYVEKLLFLAYRKTLDDFDFKIDFNEFSEIKEKFKFGNYIFEFAKTEHSVPSFAAAINDKEGKKITYTGDGADTQEVVNIAKNSDLVVAESYGENTCGHSSLNGAVELFYKARAKKLALVHICRKESIRVFESEKPEGAFIPRDLEVVEI